MNDQNRNTNVNSIENSGGQPVSDFGVGIGRLDGGPEALSLDPNVLEQPAAEQAMGEALTPRWSFTKLFKRVDVIVVLVLVLGMVALLIGTLSRHEKQHNSSATSIATQYDTQQIPLNGFVITQQSLNFTPNDVTINGSLRVNDGLIIAPSVQPNAPTAGQLYFDHNTDELAYFNGTGYVALTGQGAVVQSLGGVTGSITLGGGLSVVNNQLTAAFPTGVSSIGGISGAVTVGNGLKLVGSDIQNSGVISLTPGTPNLVVGTDGSGNLTISSVGGGSGTVTSGGGTAGRIAKFTGVQNVEDSLLSEAGTTVTANGDVSVTGSLALGTVLSVANGGTGTNNLPADGVVIGQGAGALTGVTAASPGLCLVSTVGAPAFQSCTGSTGVSSVNGLTGALTIANATGSVNTITIDDAGTSTKGIASFNGTNFTVTGGAVNTAQNITPASTPTFAGVNTNAITPSGTLTIGTATQTLNLLGSASSLFTVTGGGQTTSVGFTGSPTGAVNYLFDRAAAAGTYNICTTVGNCSGIGGSVTTPGGTANRLSKFTAGQTIGDSSISDNGSVVTVNGTANLVVQGGTATLGTLTQAGTLSISDGASHTVSIVASGLTANRVYTLPDAGGNATLCVNSGNCIGGTGAAPNAAEYLVASLNGTLTNERALTGGSNISLTDGGANSTMTVATVQNPTFTTSVTTPVLQSSGALSISSAAGTIVAIDAGTTIELQDSTNVTGSLDVSAAFTSGTANAFQVNAAGAIAAATGITSSGTVTFSGLNCTGNLNGGALTTNASGQLQCSDDDGGSSSAITGSGVAGTVPLFNGAQTITNSIITQSGTTITVAGDLTLNTALSVANGGTGTNTLNARGLLYGNGTGAVQVTAAGTGGQVLIANASGVPVFASFTGDVAVSNTGATTIQADSVALGTDTTGNYVANLGSLTGLTTTGNTGEGSTPTLSVTYGSIANTAVQGNVSLTCPSGAGNLTGGGNSVTLGAGGSCNSISTVSNPSFTTSVTTPLMILTGAGSNGTVQVANLGQGTVYTLPDPGGAAATICISTGNCSAAGSAGGDLTGTYPNPTIAKLQGTNLTITSPAAGHILVYNGTNGAWENHALTGDIAISETGASAVQANAVALGTDTTGNYVLGLTAGNGVSVTGSAAEGWSPTVTVLYGSTASTAVEGNTSISVTAGTNLTGGGAITLGAGGTVTLNVASSPTFSGTLAVQGATATIGTSSQQGSVVLNDGSSNTGTIQTAALGQNTTFTLPDPGAGTATICLSTGNCAGSGTGVTTTGGTTDRISKFTGAQALGDSTISDNGSVVTINGTANFVVQGGTGTFGTLTQAGTLAISDGSSNTVSIVAAGLAADRVYTLPDAGGAATFCLSTGNCIGGGGGGAPNNATYLLASLDGTLTNDRALANGSNIAFTDGGANSSFTVATVQNPTFTTSVTTPILQSSGALTISSAAGTTVAIDAGTTIELQDSTNVTGSLDVSAAFTAGTANAFQVNASGAITAATGITSSGTVTFSGLNCTTFANGGALTTDASGQLQCSDDDGGAGGAISGSGTSGTLPIFNGTNTITNSIVTQASTTITIAGDLVLNTALSVANGGTGANTLTTRGLLYGNGTSAVQVTAAGTGGQVLIANASGVPTFASFTGDVAVSNTGATTIQADSVALGTDTTGNYVSVLGTLTGLTTTGNTGEGSTPTLSVTYGSGANTAVQGNTSLTCPSGSGNLTGGGNSITLGTGGSCNNISTVNNPSFTTSVTTPSLILTGAGSNGTLQVATLGQATTYTLPDPGGATASICLSTGNCTAIGTAGGDLTGNYPNPTIAKLQSGTLTISSVASGNILQYNGSAWVNQSISGDITLNSSGAATIGVGKVTSGNILDNTIVNTDLASGSFGNITGVGTLGALTVVGAANINTTGTANTAIGNATGTFQVASNALNISTAGALTGVTGITTSGGYTQSGTTANTLSGATSLTAAGTALSVTNNATISGTLTTNTISPNSALTVGVAGQSFTLQGNGTSTIKSTDTGNTTTVGFVTPTANTTLNFPALTTGTYTLCTSSGNCGGVGATLQTAYANSTNPEIVLDATRGALTVRDTSGGLGANLFEVQNNAGSTTYFNVTSSGINTTGTQVSSGNINTTGGTIQTNSVDRITNSGVLTNITLGSASNNSYLCLNGTNQISSCTTTGGGTAFVQGGNSFGAAADLGTNDGNALNLRTAGTTRLVVGAAGGVTVSASNNLSVADGTFSQTSTGTSDGAVLGATNTSGTQTNGLLFNRNGSSGTTTNGVNITNTAGTLTNGLAFTGTIGTDIQRSSGTLTIQGGGGASLTTAAGASTTGSITIKSGNSSGASAGTIIIDSGTFAGASLGWVALGATNANLINVGNTNSATATSIEAGAAGTLGIGSGATGHTIHIGDNSSGVQAVSLGSLNSTSATTISGGSGNVTVQTTGASTIVKSNTTNSTTAFLVQNAIGSNVLAADTTPLNALINNGGVEGSDNSNWSLKAGTGTVARDTTQQYSGAASEKIALTSTAIGDGVKYTLPLSASANTYSLTFSIKQTAGTAIGTNLEVGYNNGSDHACTLTPSLASQPILTTGWVHYACNNFTTTGTTTFVYWKELDAPGVARTFFIDAVQLEQSSTSNPFHETALQLNGVVTSPTVFQNANNSTTAFQVQNAAGTSNLIVADTLNGGVNFGTATPSQLAQVFIQNNASGQKGLILRAASGQSVDIFDILDSGGSFVSGYDSSGNLFLNGSVQSGTTTTVGQLKLKDGTVNNRSVTLDTAALSGSITLHLPDVATGSTICTTGSVCAGYQGSGNYLVQAPTSTLTNTITPTTTNVIGLTVNGTSGATSQVAAVFNQGNATSPADTVQINTTSTGSQTNGLLFNRNAGGGTTTNGINITNTAGTLTNGLAFTGTIGTDIFRGSGTLTVQGNGGLSATTTALAGATGAVTLQSGNSSAGTAGNVTVDTGTTSTGTPTVNIASANAKAVQIGNNTSNPGVTIDSGTGTIAIGTGAQARTINFGTGGAVQGITIGSTNTTSTTTIQAGTGNINLNTNQASAGTIVKTVTNNSATAFQVQDAAAAGLFTIDTTARSVSGGNLIKIGNSTGTDTALTILQLDSSAGVPATNLAALNGGLFYNSSTSKVSIIENGIAKALCNTTDAGCGTGGSTTLDGAYTASTAPATITLTDNKNLVVNAADTTTDSSIVFNLQCTTCSSGGGRFAVQDNGTDTFSVNPNGRVSIGNVATAVPSYDLSFGNGAARVIGIETTASGGGRALTLQAGNAGSVGSAAGSATVSGGGGNSASFTAGGGTANALDDVGGNATIQGGTGGGSITVNGGTYDAGSGTQNGGSIVLSPSQGAVGGSNGILQVGSLTADAIGQLFVLDTKNTSGDPAGVNGAMYYNSSTNTFRCYQNSAWANCIGVTTSDSFRQQPFYSTDFLIDATSSGGNASAAAAPWYGNLVATAGSSVTTAAVANHPGLVRLQSAAPVNSGYEYSTGVSSILISGGESFELTFRTPPAFTSITGRMGFIDSLTVTDDTDGAYLEFSGSGVLTGKTANGGTRSSTGTTTTLSASTFYRAKITVNSAASTVSYFVYNDAGTQLWTDTLSANIPTTATHETGSGVVVTNSAGSGVTVMDLDYMALWLSKSLTR
ncbi:MAG TPA: hypothetical protein VLH86_03850 [Patescibacteria group bacterium]|nr:hypothetical protein [Patescibacteria group bacterium]